MTLTAPFEQVMPELLHAPARSATRLAIQDFAPFATALIPFSLAIGAAAAVNGLTLPQAAFGAVTILAGTAQLAATELIGSNTDIAVVVTTVLLINARFMIYGAGLSLWFAEAPLRQRLALAIPLVDQSFLSCEERFSTMTDLAERRRYYLVGTTMLMSVFLTSQLVGYLAGPILPNWLGLHLAAPLAFAGMLTKATKTQQHGIAAVAAAITIVVTAGLPGGLGLPAAIMAGVYAGNRAKQVQS